MQIGPALFHVIAIFLVCLLACADGLGKNHDIDAISVRMITLTSSICRIGKWQVRARPRLSLKSNNCDYKIFFRLITISRCLVTWWLTTKTTVGRSISFPVRLSTLDMVDFSLVRTIKAAWHWWHCAISTSIRDQSDSLDSLNGLLRPPTLTRLEISRGVPRSEIRVLLKVLLHLTGVSRV